MYLRIILKTVRAQRNPRVGTNLIKFVLCLISIKNIFQVQEAMQVTIEFKPRFYGDHQCDLIICHDTGEEIYVSLQGKIYSLFYTEKILNIN